MEQEKEKKEENDDVGNNDDGKDDGDYDDDDVADSFGCGCCLCSLFRCHSSSRARCCQVCGSLLLEFTGGIGRLSGAGRQEEAAAKEG